MNRTIWTYWEDIDNEGEPPHITLCRNSMIEHLGDCSLVIVNPENMHKYLPGVDRFWEGLEVEIQGRIDKYSRKLFKKKSRKNIAVKADVIRALLLYRYGGIYIDTDTIFLQPLDYYFQLLEEKEFFIMRRQSHGKDHMYVGFYGSQPGSIILRDYIASMRAKLQQSKDVGYNDLGASMITPIVEKHADRATVLSEKEIQPITFEVSRETFISTELEVDDVVPEGQRLFTLFSPPFEHELKDADMDTLYNSDFFLSKVFRRSFDLSKYS